MQTSLQNPPSWIPDPTLRAMFEARKRVFVDLLRWDVPVLDNAYELDQFDTRDATYVVLTDQAHRHRGSARLLPTGGPHILGSLFPRLCEGPVPSRPDLQEITRFCIEPTLSRQERRTVRNQLVTALAQHALANGITGYTAVATPNWFRQISRFGWRCRALGAERRIGGENLVALEIDIDCRTPGDLACGGIYNPEPYSAIEAQPELVS